MHNKCEDSDTLNQAQKTAQRRMHSFAQILLQALLGLQNPDVIIHDGISMASTLNFDNLSTSSKGPSSSHVPGSEHLLHPSLWSSLWKQQPVLSALIFTFLRGQHSHTHKRGNLGKAVIKSWSAQAIHLMYLSSVNGRLMVAMAVWRGLWNIYQQIALINGNTCSLSEEWDD